MRELIQDGGGSAAAAADAIVRGLARVADVFDGQLESDLPPVARLVKHVESFRGKMLRPTLTLACGLAAHPGAVSARTPEALLALLDERHFTSAAVCELVHMATLVHDDVLDEADTRRRGATINRLSGNEAAVILGDYLIASAYRLCSTLPTNEAALAVGRASMIMCEGELLQLHHRGDHSLDEATYFEIVSRKTGELIRTACWLGARASGAPAESADRLGDFGAKVGVAFQIQDDLLDLTGQASALGKPVGKDLEKGKLTLPVIHHLATADSLQRGRTLDLLRRVGASGVDEARAGLRAALDATRSLDAASQRAASLVAEAKALLGDLASTPAGRFLESAADAVVKRSF